MPEENDEVCFNSDSDEEISKIVNNKAKKNEKAAVPSRAMNPVIYPERARWDEEEKQEEGEMEE